METNNRVTINSLNVEMLEKLDREKRYKSVVQMTLMGFVICISAMMFGYGLTEISTIPIGTLVQEYSITFKPSLAQGILIGVMPFGGIFGALLFSLLLKHLRRKTAIYFLAFWMLVSVGLVQITTQYTLIFGRFLEGVVIALYVSLGPIYLRQLVAKQLRPQLASIFSLCKVIGVVIAYSIEDIMNAVGPVSYSWRILLGFPAVFCVIQAILVFFFVPESPFEMVEKNNFPQLERIVRKLYKRQFKDEIFQELKKDYQTGKAKQKAIESEAQSTSVSLVQNRKRALRMAIHITTFRQFLGANVLVTFSTQIVEAFTGVVSPAIYTGLIINCIQLFTNFLSMFTVSVWFGKRPTFLVGAIGITLFNFGIALSLFFQMEYLIVGMMCGYMTLYGATFLPLSWSYPSEIIPPSQAIIANVPGWIATAIVITVPPIVSGAMPDGNTYPLFFFFGTYGVIGSIIFYFFLIEIKGKTYQQIVKQY